mmetsp:Transcript_21934/g.55849  ORF Transcript_21934/g.55849 Transcript_21934/m.55849 type:complete len:954 (+) Transcript_21934:140-3001(+)
MVGCLGCCGSSDAKEYPKLKKGDDKDPTKLTGPINRRCTDCWCLAVFGVHLVVYFVIVFAGVQDGDPRKLYRPRDYRGDYCGMSNDFGVGDARDYNAFEKLTYLMNVTATADEVAKALVCSGPSQSALQPLMSTNDYLDYQCACCHIPCGTCAGSLGLSDFSDSASLQSSVSGRMSALTSVTGGSSLFSDATSAYTSGGDMFSQITKYFNAVCYQSSCAVPNANTVSNSYGRSYTYSPTPDLPWKTAWDTLATNNNVPTAIKNTISNQFTFAALNETICPYSAEFCVPFPGVNFTEMGAGDYCMPLLTDAAVGVLGSAVASALDSQSIGNIAEASTESVGTVAGQVWATIDALALVCFFSFIVGIIFMVLLRYLIDCCVWTSLLMVFLFALGGGGVMWVRSGQCAGASLLDSGTSAVVAVTVTVHTAAADAISTDDVSVSEDMTGNGYDYRGRQTRTRSGKLCQRWGTQNDPHNFTWTPDNYPGTGLVENYCRNPTNASTIWCMTSDASMRWEICYPVGVLQPACPEGYEITSQTMRDVLEYTSYILWGLGVLWLIICIFLRSRIQLAISINKVAAEFIISSPTILLVPIFQIITGILWLVFWTFCASFILSQVPAGYTPTASYATYLEAAGDSVNMGACNSEWPTGFAWRYSGDPTSANDTCSGVYGDTTGMSPRCWRCAQPRYALDASFAYVFFTLLWNNAFLIALGQTIIAGAVGIWFFTPKAEKGKRGTVLKSTKMVFRYHLGSLALGSFIIAVVQFIRYVMKYFEKQAAAQKNWVMVYILKAVQCCIWAFEKCIKFLTKNAYIQVALLGTNFCQSAKNAFFLILRNAARFATMVMMGAIIYYIGLMFILTCTVVIGYFTLQALYPSASPMMPVLTFIMVGYLVGKLFMNVFGLAVDTSLQCFIAAEEMDVRDDFAPGPLKKLLQPKGESKEDATPASSVAKPSQIQPQ